MTPVFELSDSYVRSASALDPVLAGMQGIAGAFGAGTDYSPDGHEARADLIRSTLTTLATLPIESEEDRRAADHLRERLEAQLAWHDIGEPLRQLRGQFGLITNLKDSVELLPRGDDDAWRNVARRLAAMPTMLKSWQASLTAGLDRGMPAARRQALGAADQAERFAGVHDALVASYGDGPLAGELAASAAKAYEGYADIARYMREEYAPRATDVDGVGAERYAVGARLNLGMDLDAEEAYEWGWAELDRIEAEIVEECARIQPGASVDEVIDLLDNSEYVTGVEAYRDWLVHWHDSAIERLHGTHFDIAEPLRTVDVTLAMKSNSGAAYYTGPSEDMSRPGRTWWPVNEGREKFETWSELSTVFHEGVPGHHLQIGATRVAGDRLSRFAKFNGVPGHAEGWALYAERLADELGWFTDRGTRLGMLTGSSFRAARVVIDIGSHLGLPLPDGSQWTFEKACEVLLKRGRGEAHRIEAEVMRYFSWPGQAIAYKLGERAWVAARDEASARPGFDLKRWHTDALNLGPIGLGGLAAALRRIS